MITNLDPLKILWVGDAVVSSGFARCTHAACDALYAAGHKVAVLGINYYGDPHSYPYPIFPCNQPLDSGYDLFGVGRLPVFVNRFRPDVVVLLNDAWNIPAYVKHLKDNIDDGVPIPKLIGWIAVDAKNQRGSGLNGLDHVVTWTQFGVDELVAGGYTGPTSIVPLGVLPHFHPIPRSESLKKINIDLPDDAFVVGVVGRNQLRKRIDLSIEYFAEWVRRFDLPNAYLYLHVAPTGDAGCDIRSLAHYHKVNPKRLLLCEPNIEHGNDDDRMPLVYSLFDVYLNTTQGEGWGLPCLEAMACDVPCIVPAWSALGEWAKDASYQVPCTSTALTAPMNGLAYTIGGIPDKEGTIEALDHLYRDVDLRHGLASAGLELASRLTWENTKAGFVEVVDKVMGRHSAVREAV